MSITSYHKGSAERVSTHFRAREFDCAGSGCCTVTPIDSMLVAYLESIRTHFGKPISPRAYRCPTHNAQVANAAKNSYHTYGRAADISISGVTPAAIAEYAESLGIPGIGLYDTFVHIDTRPKKTYWYGHEGRRTDSFLTSKETYTMTMQTLKNGSKGHAVKALQLLLTGFGCAGSMRSADGIFGPATEGAVRLFQKQQGLTVDGIAGKKTMTALLGGSDE